MVIFIFIKLKELFEQGRNYPWKKPNKCPECGSYRLWGHGYVRICFDGFSEPLLIKRNRCPDCYCVMHFRPKGYFKRIQASKKMIRNCLSGKEKHGKWNPSISRTRQRHWQKNLTLRISAYIGNTWKKGLLKGFNYLLFDKPRYIPVSCLT